MLSLILTYLTIFCIAVAQCGDSSKTTKETLKAIKLPQCQACKVLASSFKQGIDKTARHNFDGGDAAWEEEKLGTYAKSEVRLVEIQEGLCSEVERGQDQCHAIAEEAEQDLEQWWFKEQNSFPDLVQWLCVEKMQVCCPDGHYGPECKTCLGYPDKICNNNGKCKGNGTRKGNGKCGCDEGYSGEMCDECGPTFYVSYQDENKLLCSKCHSACQGACSQAGPRGCVACNPGWVMDTERGCTDINECISSDAPCKQNEFCVNNEGSHSCLACDHACNGCQGDGPDMCNKCAEGFTLHNNLCVDESKFRSNFETARYMTYFGLCVATCIIFQKNPILASIIGLCVALYVSVSVYMLGDVSMNTVFPP